LKTLEHQCIKNQNTDLRDHLASLRLNYDINNKILLIQSPQFLLESFNPDVARNRGYYAYPPTGLQWIAKKIKQNGLEVKILDLNYLVLERVINDEKFDYNNWLQILEEYLENYDPSIVGVTSINVNSNIYEPGYPLTSILKLLMAKDNCIVLAGGAIATDEHEELLKKDYCHFVIGNEGENKIKFLFDNIYGNTSEQNPVQGIYFKFENVIKQSVGIFDSVSLKGNLIDTYNLIPTEKYNLVGCLNPYSRMVGKDTRYSVFNLYRGCTAKCEFCDVNNFMGNGVRHFPVDDVIKDIDYLINNKGIHHFDVLDDAFLANAQVATEFLKELTKLNDKYGITWSSNNGLIATQLNEHLMKLMQRSGCVGFRIGVESGNAMMLKRMRKPATLSKLRKAAILINDYPNMFTGANYILGLFGDETFGEMIDTFKFSSELNLDWASFATFQFTSNRTPGSNLITKETRKSGGDFVPAKGDSKQTITINKNVITGPNLFNISDSVVPPPAQIKEIWFAFNLVGNYINNKNLRNNQPHKFLSWVNALLSTFPNNAYMALFQGIARVLIGEMNLARKSADRTRKILRQSEYWENRFIDFKLNNLILNFPKSYTEANEQLVELRKQYEKWLI